MTDPSAGETTAAVPKAESGTARRKTPAAPADENARYRDARAKAGEDAHVRSLQEKMDAAPEGPANAEAARDYYKALYDQMRKIDPSLGERIDRTEAATLRRLEKRE